MIEGQYIFNNNNLYLSLYLLEEYFCWKNHRKRHYNIFEQKW